jgi:hypothetical protein
MITQYSCVLVQADYQANIVYRVAIDIRQSQFFIDQIRQSSNGQIVITAP